MTFIKLRSVISSEIPVRVLRVAMAPLLLMLLFGTATESAHAQCDPPRLHTLLAPDGEDGDGLGYSVDVSGTTAIAGAPFDDDIDEDSGSAYLFSTGTGELIARLLPDDGSFYELFGFSVAISNGRAIVGSPNDSDNGIGSGSAYIFDTAGGAQLAKLLPDDGTEDAAFGASIAADGAIAVIGAPGDDDNGEHSGSVYLFDITTGVQIAKLLPDDGAAGDWFGRSVAISGATVIVGSYQDDDNGENSGSAYLFDLATGDQVTKLLPDGGEADDWFGTSVAISGSTAVVAAPRNFESGFAYGSAYVFDTVTGNQTHKLQILPGEDFTEFGMSVAIDGATALVGARVHEYYGTDGEVYLFDTTTGNRFARFDYGWSDGFGESVAYDGLTMMVGAYNAWEWCGAAYLYGPCPAVGADFTCMPSSGWVPFSTQMTATLFNFRSGLTRRIAGRLNVTLAHGTHISSWHAGFTNVAGGGNYVASWNQNIPSLEAVIGPNLFELEAEDVTPAPYNQPPYPPAGDTATASCTVTGLKP